MRFSRIVARLGMAGILLGFPAACAPTADVPPVARGVAPVARPAPELPPYRLQIGDVLDIKFPGAPQYNEQVVIPPDGQIWFTALNRPVQAYNRTLEELSEAIRSSPDQNLKSSQPVALVLRSFAPNRVYVVGEVNSGGEFVTVGPNLTMVQAIARAGGLRFTANRDKVLIIRRGASEKPEVFAADYFAATDGGDPTADVRLAPYDVVFVPRTGLATAYTNFQQLQQFLPPTFGFSYEVNK